MRVGTRSLLFGVHQVVIHPLFTAIAWWRIYGFPWDLRLWLCFVVHDWGYWGKPNMDGPEGERHVLAGARIAGRLLGPRWRDQCLGHSRHYARTEGLPVSRLCYADKLATALYPAWLYLLLARLSGELREYRRLAAETGFVPLEQCDRCWFDWIRERMRRIAFEGKPAVAPYVNPVRS